MDEFICDYSCRTVGESITKHNIPNDWCAEFDAYDGIYPIICVQVGQIRKNPSMMDLPLRIIENQDDEYASCILVSGQKTISFKINFIGDLRTAMEKE